MNKFKVHLVGWLILFYSTSATAQNRLLLIAYPPAPEAAFIADLTQVLESLSPVDGPADTPAFNEINYFNRLVEANVLIDAFNRMVEQDLNTQGLPERAFADSLGLRLKAMLFCPDQLLVLKKDSLSTSITLELYPVDSCLASWDFITNVLKSTPQRVVTLNWAQAGDRRSLRENLTILFPHTNQPATVTYQVQDQTLRDCDQGPCQVSMRTLDTLRIETLVEDPDSKHSTLQYHWWVQGIRQPQTDSAALVLTPTGRDTVRALRLWITDGVDSSAVYELEVSEVAPPAAPKRFTHASLWYMRPYQRWSFTFSGRERIFAPDPYNVGGIYPLQLALTGPEGEVLVYPVLYSEVVKEANLRDFQRTASRIQTHRQLLDSLEETGQLPDQALFVYYDSECRLRGGDLGKSQPPIWYYVPHQLAYHQEYTLQLTPTRGGHPFPPETRRLWLSQTQNQFSLGLIGAYFLIPSQINQSLTNPFEQGTLVQGGQFSAGREIDFFGRGAPTGAYGGVQLTVWSAPPFEANRLHYAPLYPEVYLELPLKNPIFPNLWWRNSWTLLVGYQQVTWQGTTYHHVPVSYELNVMGLVSNSVEVKASLGIGGSVLDPEANNYHVFSRATLQLRFLHHTPMPERE